MTEPVKDTSGSAAESLLKAFQSAVQWMGRVVEWFAGALGSRAMKVDACASKVEVGI